MGNEIKKTIINQDEKLKREQAAWKRIYQSCNQFHQFLQRYTIGFWWWQKSLDQYAKEQRWADNLEAIQRQVKAYRQSRLGWLSRLFTDIAHKESWLVYQTCKERLVDECPALAHPPINCPEMREDLVEQIQKFNLVFIQRDIDFPTTSSILQKLLNRIILLIGQFQQLSSLISLPPVRKTPLLEEKPPRSDEEKNIPKQQLSVAVLEAPSKKITPDVKKGFNKRLNIPEEFNKILSWPLLIKLINSADCYTSTIQEVKNILLEYSRSNKQKFGQWICIDSFFYNRTFINEHRLNEVAQIVQVLYAAQSISSLWPWCNLLLMSSNGEEKLIHKQLQQISKDHCRAPILIKQGDVYSVFGSTDAIHWKITELNSDICKKFAALFPRQGETIELEVHPANKELYTEIIVKKGHTVWSDRSLENEIYMLSNYAERSGQLGYTDSLYTNLLAIFERKRDAFIPMEDVEENGQIVSRRTDIDSFSRHSYQRAVEQQLPIRVSVTNYNGLFYQTRTNLGYSLVWPIIPVIVLPAPQLQQPRLQ